MKMILYIFVLFVVTLTGIGQEDVKDYFLISKDQNKQSHDTIVKNLEISYGRNYDYRKDKADAFKNLAELEKENDNLPGALRYFLSAIYEYEIIADSNSIANIRVEIGEIFQKGQLYDKALEYYKRAEVIFLNEGTIENNIQLLENIAQVYYRKEDFQKSLNYYNVLKIFISAISRMTN